MALVVNLLELQLGSGTRYWSTHDVGPDGVSAIVDSSGNVYDGGLKPFPRIVRKLSDEFFGIVDDGTLTCNIGALDQSEAAASADWAPAAEANAVATIFRASDARGRRAILRRGVFADDGTLTVTDRFYGIVEQVEFSSDGSIELTIIDQATDVLESQYPRLTVDKATFPTAVTDARFALDATLPIHLGAHREHAPCRYVEGVDRLYANGTTQPRVTSLHRYLVGCDLAATVNGYANVQPHVNSLYLGTTLGSSLVGPGEYVVRHDRRLVFSAGLAVSTVAGGTLAAATYTYDVSAWNGVRESTVITNSRTITATDVTNGDRTVRLTWNRVDGATAYYVRRGGQLLHIVGVGATASFDDTGAYTPITYDAAPTSNLTGQNVIEVTAEGAMLSKSDEQAPVLADVEYTEMGWASDVVGLWHFRGASAAVHDSKPQQNNYLRRSGALGFWTFRGNGNSQTGANNLTLTGATLSDYVPGPFGKSCLKGNGSLYASITDAAQDGNLDRGTSTTRISALLKTDPQSSSRRNMVICEKYGGSPGPGYTFRVSDGILVGEIGDGSDVVTVSGSTILDGAWHVVEMLVNRSTNRLELYVDGVLDCTSTDITAVGSLDNSADFGVLGTTGSSGGTAMYGELDWLMIDNDVNPLTPLLTGKAGTSPSAVDFQNSTVQKTLYIADAVQTGLDLGNTGWTIEAWIKTSTGPGGNLKVICQKYDASLGGYRFGVIAVSGVDRLQAMTVNGTGPTLDTVTATTGAAFSAGTWHHVAFVQDNSASEFRLYQDGELVGSASASDTDGGDNAQPFLIGADNTTGNNLFPGIVDELRLTSRARTVAEIREAYYLGMRNPVRQLRTLLTSAAHGPGLTCDTTSWDTAESDVATAGSGKLVTDYAMVEPARLRDHLREFTKVRGLRLTVDGSGQVDCVADTQQASSATFGWQDGGIADGLMAARPTWFSRPLKESPVELRLHFRRQRSGDGGTAKFLLRTEPRGVAGIGLAEPLVLEMAAVRDPECADRVAYYRAARGLYSDQGCKFTAGEIGLGLSLGSVITIYDPSSGISASGELHEVWQLEEQGQKIGVTTRRWNSSIYSYTDLTLADPESEPDYSATLPPMVSGFSAEVAVAVQNDGSRTWTPSLTWTAPTSTNVVDVVLEFRESTETPWRHIGVYTKAASSATGTPGGLDDNKTYQFRIFARNRFGLSGPTSQVSQTTTTPGAPATVSTITAKGGGHRSRRWAWVKSSEKNIVGYDYEIRTATGGGGTLIESGTIGGNRSSFTYTEAGLGRTDTRVLRLKARNASGQTSASWSEVTGTSGDTVTTDDAAANAFTDPHVASGNLANASGSFSDIASSTITLNGGTVLIQAEVQINCSSDWAEADQAALRITKGGSAVRTIDPIFSGIQAGANPVLLTLAIAYVDTAGSSGSTTYAVQGKRTGSATTVQMVGYLSAVEFKK